MPQGNPKEGALVAWDPGGKLAGEDTAESKGPAEAKKDTTAGIDAHKKNPCCAKSSQSGCTIRNRDDHAPLQPSIIVPSCRRGVHLLFVSRTIERAPRCPGRCQGRDCTTSWWPSPASHCRHLRPHATHLQALARDLQDPVSGSGSFAGSRWHALVVAWSTDSMWAVCVSLAGEFWCETKGRNWPRKGVIVWQRGWMRGSLEVMQVRQR